MFSVGDIAQVFSPVAGKKKYHLCVCCANEHGVERFLFINSGDGYEGDIVVDDKAIGCLPESPTGQSVISCSIVVRYTDDQLKKYNAKKLGELRLDILEKVAKTVSATKALSKEERNPISASLSAHLKAKAGKST